ncbi:MAG: hypothetical protein ACRD6W_08505 [Nitrososphaerales archaeon]
MAETCPLCGESVWSLLEHYSIDHQIKTPEQFEVKLAKVKTIKARQEAKAALVEALNEKQSKGLITGEEWRRQVKNWEKEHPIE